MADIIMNPLFRLIISNKKHKIIKESQYITIKLLRVDNTLYGTNKREKYGE